MFDVFKLIVQLLTSFFIIELFANLIKNLLIYNGFKYIEYDEIFLPSILAPTTIRDKFNNKCDNRFLRFFLKTFILYPFFTIIYLYGLVVKSCILFILLILPYWIYSIFCSIKQYYKNS
jgi:hypothetical protein